MTMYFFLMFWNLLRQILLKMVLKFASVGDQLMKKKTAAFKCVVVTFIRMRANH